MDAALVVVFAPPRQGSPLGSTLLAKPGFKALFSTLFRNCIRSPLVHLNFSLNQCLRGFLVTHPLHLLHPKSYHFVIFFFYVRIYQVRDLPDPPCIDG